MIRTLILTLIASALAFGSAGSAAMQATRVNHYESPCYKNAREVRGIPAPSARLDRGLLAWTMRHLDGRTPDAQLRDYWNALDRCDRTAPVAHFDYDNLVLVSIENI